MILNQSQKDLSSIKLDLWVKPVGEMGAWAMGDTRSGNTIIATVYLQ